MKIRVAHAFHLFFCFSVWKECLRCVHHALVFVEYPRIAPATAKLSVARCKWESGSTAFAHCCVHFLQEDLILLCCTKIFVDIRCPLLVVTVEVHQYRLLSLVRVPVVARSSQCGDGPWLAPSSIGRFCLCISLYLELTLACLASPVSRH